MKYQVRLSARAEVDVDGVLAWFVEQRASAAAARWLAQLQKKIGTLERMPLRCPLAAEAEEIGQEIRELYIGRRQGRYRILFCIDGRVVSVLHIRHAARDRLREDDLSSFE